MDSLRSLEEKSSCMIQKARNENLPLQAIQLYVNKEKSVIEGFTKFSTKDSV